MITVFLGGSRRVSRLNQVIRRRLDEVMRRGLMVLVGDANGADRAMQRYLADAGYGRVTVFAVESHLRNNEGAWQVRYVHPPHGATGYALYAAKDRAMAEAADAGLMLWDGKSRGTLQNIRRLLQRHKPLAVYYSPKKRFVNVTTPSEFAAAFPTAARNFGHDGLEGPADWADQISLLKPAAEVPPKGVERSREAPAGLDHSDSLLSDDEITERANALERDGFPQASVRKLMHALASHCRGSIAEQTLAHLTMELDAESLNQMIAAHIMDGAPADYCGAACPSVAQKLASLRFRVTQDAEWRVTSPDGTVLDRWVRSAPSDGGDMNTRLCRIAVFGALLREMREHPLQTPAY